MAIQYPPKPWQDGQVFNYDLYNGEIITGQYNASKNLWNFSRSSSTGSSGIITTANVYTLNTRPVDSQHPFALTGDPTDVVNQQEVNWWLYEHLGARSPIFSPTPPTENPAYNPPDNELTEGDVWINNRDPNAYVFLIWDGLKWVPTGQTARPPIFDENPPGSHPDITPGDLIPGDIWYDTTDPDALISHIWDGTNWLPVGAPVDATDAATKEYVDEKFASATGGGAAATVTIPFRQVKAGSSGMVQPGYFYPGGTNWNTIGYILIGFRGWDNFTPIEFPKNAWLRVIDPSTGNIIHYGKVDSAYKFDNDRLKLNLSSNADDKMITGGTIASTSVFEVIGVFTEN